MKFLNRQEENKRLDNLVARQVAGLVAVWGRRRVGKTRLLMEWSRRHGGVYTVADQSSEAVQRRYFAEAVAARLPGFNEVEYSSWQPLLRRLSQDARAAQWRGPLILDELPYLVISTPALPSILQNWIDQERQSDGLLVAVAGSSQRMMQGLVLDASSPLYGRAQEALDLQPLAPAWIAPALGLTTATEMVQAYAIWGGIPRYWELAEPYGNDLDASVERLVLDPLSPLHLEPDRLLLEEQPSATCLRPLLDVIGCGAHRLSEIAGRLNVPATSLSRALVRLVELGLVRRDIPFGESEKGGKRALYRISDPFFRFWFRVVAPHRALLASADAPARLACWKQAQDALEAETWEALCRQYASRIAARMVPNTPAWHPGLRWWHGNAPEWDVVSIPVNGRCALLGEAKWSARPMSCEKITQFARELSVRPPPPGVPPNAIRVLFVPLPGESTPAVLDGVHVVDATTLLDNGFELNRGAHPKSRSS